MAQISLSTGDTVDRYCIESVLGSGGMATVYRVRHTVLGSLHALKLVHRADPSWFGRILREGRAQAQLRHPNIVAVTDVISYKDAPALVLEYVEGPSLERMVRAQPLTLRQVDRVARGIMAGVASAHEWGLVHRDLKPANILFSMQDGEVVPKIADFGLVRDPAGGFLEPRTTRSGVMMGTPAYMAPEQFESAKHVDQRADIFSLGAVLYFLATGHEAFIDKNDRVLMKALLNGEPPDPQATRTDLPDAWAKVMRRAMMSDPDHRFQDVAEMLAAWKKAELRDAAGQVAGPTWNPLELQRLGSLGAGPLPAPHPTGSWSPGAKLSEDSPTTSRDLPSLPSAAVDSGLDSRFGGIFDSGANPTNVPDYPPPPRRPWMVLGSTAAMGLVAVACLGLGGIVSWQVWGTATATTTADPGEEVLALGSDEASGGHDTEPPDLQGDTEELPLADPGGVVSAEASVVPAVRSGSSKGKGSTGSKTPASAGTTTQGPVEVAPEVIVSTGSTSKGTGSTQPVTGTYVEVNGGVRSYLIDGRGRSWQPGSVPAGTYELWVFFDPGSPTKVMNLTLAKDEQRRLNCQSGLQICR